ncbi:MAG: hypothetical protein NUK65_09490 [Firmicutes bacterium]|nr:hypothetical protein [Bacillota bacterium]
MSSEQEFGFPAAINDQEAPEHENMVSWADGNVLLGPYLIM